MTNVIINFSEELRKALTGDSRDINISINKKPPYTVNQLIAQALAAAPKHTLSLSAIYSYITRNYSFYRSNEDWHVS